VWSCVVVARSRLPRPVTRRGAARPSAMAAMPGIRMDREALRLVPPRMEEWLPDVVLPAPFADTTARIKTFGLLSFTIETLEWALDATPSSEKAIEMNRRALKQPAGSLLAVRNPRVPVRSELT